MPVALVTAALAIPVLIASESIAPNGSGPRVTLQLVSGLDEHPVAGQGVSVVPTVSPGGRAPNLLTDPEGQIEVPPALVNDRWPAWRITVDSYVPVTVDVAALLTESDQVRSRVKLDRADLGGGRILDEDGRPVAGAQVAVLFDVPPADIWFVPNSFHLETTDRDGRWRCHHLAAESGPARLVIVHPDFAPLVASAGSAPGAASFRFDELKEERSVLFLQRGKRIQGRVVNEDDQPVEGARILSSHYPLWTPADGRFELPIAGGSSLKLLIHGPHHESLVRWVGPDDRAGKLKITLPAHVRRLLVVRDEASRPVADGLVHVVDGLNANADIRRTASNGEIEIGDGELTVSVFKTGFRLVDNVPVSADASPVEVNMSPLIELSARVVDDESGKPVSGCTVVPGLVVNGDTQWLNDRKSIVRHGQLRVRFQPDAQMIRLAIEAGDYYQKVIPPVSPSKWDATAPIRLQRRKTISGKVRRSDGSPGVGARIAAVPKGGRLVVGSSGSLDVPPAWFVVADPDGSFALSPPVPAAYLVASDHANGFGLLDVSNSSAPTEITLQAWGEVEGVVKSGGQPVPDQLVALATDSRSPIGLAANTFVQRADSAGHFHFASVPPVAMRIGKYDSGMSHSQPMKIIPGGRVTVSFPQKGWRVHGQAVWHGSALDWSGESHLALIRSLPADKDDESTMYPMTMRPDGEFSVGDIPAGTFELVIHYHELSADGSGRLDDKYHVTMNLSLPALPTETERPTHELGILELKPGPSPTKSTAGQSE